jgi:hypothetical protein
VSIDAKSKITKARLTKLLTTRKSA